MENKAWEQIIESSDKSSFKQGYEVVCSGRHGVEDHEIEGGKPNSESRCTKGYRDKDKYIRLRYKEEKEQGDRLRVG